MIGIGCDHGGYALKLEIIKYLEKKEWHTRILAVTENL